MSGTSRADRDGGRLENYVQPVSKIPSHPDHFDEEHAVKWRSVCEELDRHEMLFDLDRDALTLYVENWIMARHAWQDLQDNGMTIWVRNEKGLKPVTNPAFRQYQDAMKVVQPLQDKFGLNIRARMAIKVEPPKKQKDSPIMALLTKRKTA